MEVGRLLAEATGAEFQGVTGQDLASLIEEISGYLSFRKSGTLTHQALCLADFLPESGGVNMSRTSLGVIEGQLLVRLDFGPIHEVAEGLCCAVIQPDTGGKPLLPNTKGKQDRGTRR